MVFSCKSVSKHSKNKSKRDNSSEGSISSAFGLHSPLRLSKLKQKQHQQQNEHLTDISPPIPISEPSSSRFLELPGATSSASTTPSQFSESHSPTYFQVEEQFNISCTSNNATEHPNSCHHHNSEVKIKQLPYQEVPLSVEYSNVSELKPPLEAKQYQYFFNGDTPLVRVSDSPIPSPWHEESLNSSMGFELSPHQQQTLKEAFDFFDIDHDGCITSSELQSVFEFLGSPVTSDQVEVMISEADIDGNGTVEFNEFLRMMKRYYHKHQAPCTEEEEMIEAFKAFDHNGDSFIDFDEIKKTMHFLGEAVSDDEVRAMIREADVDKDGRINYEEFKKMMSLMHKGSSSRGQKGATSK